MEIGVSEAARLAGVSATTIANWRRQGWLPSEMSPWGYHTYRAEDVLEARRRKDEAQREIDRLRTPPHRMRRRREDVYVEVA